MSSVDREAPDIFFEVRRRDSRVEENIFSESMSTAEWGEASRMLTDNFIGGMASSEPVYQSGRPQDYILNGSVIESRFTVAEIEGGVRFGDEEMTGAQEVSFVKRNYLSPERGAISFMGEMVSAMGDRPTAIPSVTAEMIDKFGESFGGYYAGIESDREGITAYPHIDDFGVLRVFAGEDYAAGRIDRQDFETVMRLTDLKPLDVWSESALKQIQEAGAILYGAWSNIDQSEARSAAD